MSTPGVPTAAFLTPATCRVGDVVQLLNTTTVNENYTATYVWTFSDGTTSTATEPVKVATTPGVLTIMLRAAGPIGTTDALHQVTIRPNTNTRAGSIGEGTVSINIETVNDEQYAGIPQRGVTNAIPQVMLDNGGYPNRQLLFWPIPTDRTVGVELWCWEPLGIYTSPTEELNLPRGYERWLTYTLALELSDLFGKPPSADIIASQAEAEEALQSINRVALTTPASDLALSLNSTGTVYNKIDFLSGAWMLSPRAKTR
jgi:hypothetical protein